MSTNPETLISTATGKNLFKNLFHEDYMEIIFLQVENSTFAVPKHVLNCPGTVFNSMFSLPSGENNRDEGTKENPILLEHVTEKDFEAFLHVLYPLFRYNGMVTLLEGIDYWIGVLILAKKWEFEEVRSQAEEEVTILLESKNPVLSVLLGREHQIKRWIRRGYIRLICFEQLDIANSVSGLPDTSISFDWKVMVSLLWIRSQVISTLPLICIHCNRGDWMLRSGKCSRCGRFSNIIVKFDVEDAGRLVDEHFREELDSANS